MKRTVLLGASLALLMIAGPSVAHHRPGHQGVPGGGGGPLSARANPTPVTYAAPTTVSGKLTGPNNGAQLVTLAEDKFPYGDGFVDVTTTRTDGNGDYSFRQVPDSNRNYRVTVGSNQAFTSVRVRMRVSRRVSDSTPRRGQVVRFSGFVSPKHDGRAVLLQRRSATGVWVTVRRAALTATTGNRSAYATTRAVRSSGTYRARVLADGDHLTGTSALVRLSVG
jgi:hypothetical protein